MYQKRSFLYGISLNLLVLTLAACSHSNTGSKKQLKLSVGEIKDVTLPGRGDGTSELIGTSDNQEVVEVSRQQLAPPVDTLKRDKGGPTTFQIKGITVGTANVVFTQKPLGATGPGEPVRTYIVQVQAN